MSATPRVSVLLPVYNGGAFLAAALESVLGQTFADFEVVAVNDGSTDGSAEILADFAARDARVIVHHHTANHGLVATLNHAIALARGPYLARQDADDLSRPERFAAQLAVLDQQLRIGLVSGWVEIIDDAGQTLDLDFFSKATTNAEIQQELLTHNSLCHGSVMLRRAVLDQIGRYTPELESTEDYDLWLRLAEVAELARCPQVVYQYRNHPQSMTHTGRPRQSLNQARSLERAMYRRHGPRPAPETLRQTALMYLAAAEFYLRQDDLDGLAQQVSHALALCPPLADAPDIYLPLPPGAAGEVVLAEVFRQLPPTADMRQRYRRRRAQRHMQAAFAAAQRGDRVAAAADIWAGLRYDGRWLRNRGVLALLTKGLFARRRPSIYDPARGHSE